MPYTKNISLRDFYNYYKDNCKKKNIKYKTYSEYSKLLKEFNLRVRDKLIYEAETLTLPFRLGNLYIKKFEVSYEIDNQKNWRIDFKKSKELGHKVYFGSPYGYRWSWNKRNCIVKGKKFYTFKPCRTASRLIADAINNKKLDFYNK